MKIFTQFLKESIWVETSLKDALSLISGEFPETDAEGTFEYIKKEGAQGKVITLGECRFKIENEAP